MWRRTLAVASLALLASSAAAQIPEAPGSAGVAPRDEEPGRARSVAPPAAPRGGSADDEKPPEPSARDIVDTMEKAKAASAKPPKPRARRTGRHRHAPHHAPTPAR